MVLSIRNKEADTLARKLASFEKTTVTEAVIIALKTALKPHMVRETPSEITKRLLVKHGLSFRPDRKPVPKSVFHDLHSDIYGDEECS
jgi:antitoxin VapB